ncbi:MAG TPA: DUF420 domain-containing protein [Candidatus Xenobia bacterium]
MRTLLYLCLALLLTSPARAADHPLAVLGTVPDFTLTNQLAAGVHGHDLQGTIWVADFIYTTCPGPCPILTRHMADLASRLPDSVRVVSFSVDPTNDTPAVLKAYAATYGADPSRWWFLTGTESAIFALARDNFHLATDKGPDGPFHSPYFALVDGEGRIRQYYDGNDADLVPRVIADVDVLQQGRWGVLSTVDAGLNGLSGVLVALGFFFIRRRQVAAHKACMLSAVVSSSVFLVSYLTYHWHVHHVIFPGQGTVRTVYLSILASHSVLAAAVPPLVLITLARALNGRFPQHRAMARWTLPIWLYVSVTGVVVYVMLRHWNA